MTPADVLALHEQCFIAECREYSIRDSVDDAISTSVPCPIKTLLHGGAMWFTVDSLADIIEREVLPDDYYRVEPDTPFGPEETWFDAGAFAADIFKAAERDEDESYHEPTGYSHE